VVLFRVKKTAFLATTPVVYMRTYSLDEHKLLFQPLCGIEVIMRRTVKKILLSSAFCNVQNGYCPFGKRKTIHSVPICFYKKFLSVDVNIGFMVASTPRVIHTLCIVYIVLLR
jgi:hypothetical protein